MARKKRPAPMEGPGMFGELPEAELRRRSPSVPAPVWSATRDERRQLLKTRQAMWDALDRDDPDRASYVQAVVEAEQAYTRTMVRRIVQ